MVSDRGARRTRLQRLGVLPDHIPDDSLLCYRGWRQLELDDPRNRFRMFAGGARYFFDIPVYRLTEERYNAERQAWIDGAMYPGSPANNEQRRAFYAANRDNENAARDRFWQLYGGCWRYNEIIGYVRLHFFGSQLRGEYYGVTARRIVRTRKKIIEHQTHKLAPEMDIPGEASSQDIFQIVLSYVAACATRLRGRYLDRTLLLQLGPCIDWRRLYNADQNLVGEAHSA